MCQLTLILMRKKWPACSASRVVLTAVIVAVSLYINVNLNYADDHSSRFVNELPNNLKHSEGLIETIQCDTVDYLPVGWCLDIDLIPRYIDDNVTFITARSFELKRYTVKGMEQCLSNKTIVFIGDSRTRYQYMHLGLSLKIGRFMSCPDIPKGTTFRDLEYDFEYDIECLGIASQKSNYQSWEGEGGIQNVTTWNDVFKHSTEMLRSSSSNHSTTGTQDSICDCYRPIKKFDPDNFYENRYTKRTTKEFGEINLIHLENLQDRVSMNEDYPPYQPFYSTSTKRCKPGECGRGGHGNNNNKWVGDLNASLYDIVPLLNATHLFVNPGWDWEGDISCMLHEFENHHRNIKVAYLSHPIDLSSKTGKYHHTMLHPKDMKCQEVDTIDRTTMTMNVPSSWYVDNLHVWSILNEEFNQMMMKLICPIE